MTKKNIVIISAGLAVILILAVFYGVMSITSDKPSDDTKNNGENITETIIEKVFTANSPEKLSSILLSKGDKTEYLIRKDALVDSFLIDGLEGHNYSTSFNNVISSVSGLSVTGRIEDPLADEEYGLSLQDSP